MWVSSPPTPDNVPWSKSCCNVNDSLPASRCFSFELSIFLWTFLLIYIIFLTPTVKVDLLFYEFGQVLSRYTHIVYLRLQYLISSIAKCLWSVNIDSALWFCHQRLCSVLLTIRSNLELKVHAHFGESLSHASSFSFFQDFQFSVLLLIMS